MCAIAVVCFAVIIKGTQIYDAESGGWKELSMLDIGQVRRTTVGRCEARG